MLPSKTGLFLPLLTVALIAGFSAPAVHALVPAIDLGSGIDLSDDAGIYVTVLSRYSGRDIDQVQQLYDLCTDKDDLAVVLHLAQATGKSPGFILTLRGQNMSWWEISEGLAVNPNDWFVPVTRGPSPPFAAPYAKWRSAGTGGPPCQLSDGDCRNLAAAVFLHRYFQVTIARAMEMRATGPELEKCTSEEVRRRQIAEQRRDKKVADGSAS